MGFHFMRRVAASLFVVAMGSSSVSAQQSVLPDTHAQVGRQQEARLPTALEGFCSVCLMRGHQWVKGTAEHSVVYDGRRYFFPGEDEKKAFQSSPLQYAPVLNGDSVIAYASTGRRMPGDIRHATIHGGRLYLFQSAAEKRQFSENPDRYARADLALGGRCAVCRTHGGNVAGKPQFPVRYDGLEYWFPSSKQQTEFLAQPEKYAVKSAAPPEGAASSASCPCGSKNCKACQARAGVAVGTTFTGSTGDPKVDPITVRGTTTCASCEYGVPPIGANDTLGLAVEPSDGKVYIVEDAHKLYPTLYKDRFQAVPVELKGQILQTKGKFVWVKPSSVKVVR